MSRTGFVSALVLMLGLVSYSGNALAREKQTIGQGLPACNNYCEAHNKTARSINGCKNGCLTYWLCNGADADATSCALARAG
jgi:hypothetical protein